VVSHDLRKFAKLLASPNGYALEQVLPWVIASDVLHVAHAARRAGHRPLPLKIWNSPSSKLTP
jgi:hypothetical protein